VGRKNQRKCKWPTVILAAKMCEPWAKKDSLIIALGSAIKTSAVFD